MKLTKELEAQFKLMEAYYAAARAYPEDAWRFPIRNMWHFCTGRWPANYMRGDNTAKLASLGIEGILATPQPELNRIMLGLFREFFS